MFRWFSVYPDELTLNVLFSGATVTENTWREVNCDASESFPAAIIKWYSNDRELTNSTEFQITETDLEPDTRFHRTRSRVVFRVSRDFNGYTLECRVVTEDNVILHQRETPFVFNVIGKC